METTQIKEAQIGREIKETYATVRVWRVHFLDYLVGDDGLGVVTNESGSTFYTPDALTRIRTVQNLLRETGFTIAGARKHLGLPAKTDNRRGVKRPRSKAA